MLRTDVVVLGFKYFARVGGQFAQARRADGVVSESRPAVRRAFGRGDLELAGVVAEQADFVIGNDGDLEITNRFAESENRQWRIAVVANNRLCEQCGVVRRDVIGMCVTTKLSHGDKCINVVAQRKISQISLELQHICRLRQCAILKRQ